MSGLDSQPIQAVLVDDNGDHLNLLACALENTMNNRAQFVVHKYRDPHVALAELPAEGPAIILCDYQLGSTSGIEWLSDFERAEIGPVIIITSSGDQQIASEAFRNGASDYLDKSVAFENPHEFEQRIHDALRRFTLENANKTLTRQLKLSNTELRETNARLSDLADTAHRFVEDVAHEFRTPLAVIMEFASIISDGLGGEVTPAQREYLEFITSATSDLTQLVDDFLDSGKLRAGTLRVERKPQNILHVLEDLLPIVRARGSIKNVDVACECPTDLPYVYVDAEKTRRTIVNLVVNAIKFSNPGQSVRIWAEQDSDDMIRIGVSDMGPGMSPEQVQQLFKRFEQGTPDTQISAKGFGLGLCIVKELVAINLGSVSVSSVLGEGSTFSVTVPIAGAKHVLYAFIARALERDRNGRVHATSLRVNVPKLDMNGIRMFVASVCHPNDIVLPGIEDGQVVILSDGSDWTELNERLSRMSSDRISRLSDQSESPFSIEPLGSWSIYAASDQISELIDHTHEEFYHGEVSTHC